MRTDKHKQTDRHARHNTPLPCRGGANISYRKVREKRPLSTVDFDTIRPQGDTRWCMSFRLFHTPRSPPVNNNNNTGFVLVG